MTEVERAYAGVTEIEKGSGVTLLVWFIFLIMTGLDPVILSSAERRCPHQVRA